MEKDWLEEIKDVAQAEAEVFMSDMESVADKFNVERVWFIEEVLLNIRKMKGGRE